MREQWRSAIVAAGLLAAAEGRGFTCRGTVGGLFNGGAPASGC